MTRNVLSPGTGTFVFLFAEYEGALCGFSSLGKRGKRAETVSEEAAAEFLAQHYPKGRPSIPTWRTR
ncbi:MAG: hypothetical protein M0Z52_13840 [Actinomycetota bacterium]|nr:hypothetical protein [Nitrospiraceae bacterium]MDA8157512.1 hypothetical protein [Actinomycetota bacterium]